MWTPVNVLQSEAAWDYEGEYHVISPSNTSYNPSSKLTYISGNFHNFATPQRAIDWLENNSGEENTTYRIEGFDESDRYIGDVPVKNSPTENPNPTDCASENREDGADDSVCGDCLSGYTEDDTGTCVADRDCASENRVLNDDDSCGDCLSGYTEDTIGDCVADATDEEKSKLPWIIGAIVVVGGAYYFTK